MGEDRFVASRGVPAPVRSSGPLRIEPEMTRFYGVSDARDRVHRGKRQAAAAGRNAGAGAAVAGLGHRGGGLSANHRGNRLPRVLVRLAAGAARFRAVRRHFEHHSPVFPAGHARSGRGGNDVCHSARVARIAHCGGGGELAAQRADRTDVAGDCERDRRMMHRTGCRGTLGRCLMSIRCSQPTSPE